MADGANNQFVGVKCQRIPLIACISSFTIYGKRPEGDLKMPSVIEYGLYLLADLAVIGFIVHFSFGVFHENTAVQRFMAGNGPSFNKHSFTHSPCSSASDLRCTAHCSFSSHGCHTGGFTAKGGWPSCLRGVLGSDVAVARTGKNECQDFKIGSFAIGVAKSNNFAQLIKLELAEIGRTRQYPEQPDPLLRLAHLIDEAEKRQTIYPEHAKLCRQLLDVIRMAVPLPAKHSTINEAPPS
jgi:hypothetical protein